MPDISSRERGAAELTLVVATRIVLPRPESNILRVESAYEFTSHSQSKGSESWPVKVIKKYSKAEGRSVLRTGGGDESRLSRSQGVCRNRI